MKDPFEQPKKAAQMVESWVAKQGLLPLIDKDSRFDHIIAIKYKPNREFVFCNAYAVVWEDWLLVISTPNNSQFNLMDVEEYSMTDRETKKSIPINRVIIKNNQVQTVPV
jgi:hypothetical protein